MLRRGGARARPKATAEISRGVRWLRGARAGSRASSVAADGVRLELAKELGDAAPAASANGKGYWAHGIAKQARALLAGEDAEDEEDEEDARRDAAEKEGSLRERRGRGPPGLRRCRGRRPDSDAGDGSTTRPWFRTSGSGLRRARGRSLGRSGAARASVCRCYW